MSYNLSSWSNDWSIIFMTNMMKETLCENISNSQQNMLLYVKERIHCCCIIVLTTGDYQVNKCLLISYS